MCGLRIVPLNVTTIPVSLPSELVGLLARHNLLQDLLRQELIDEATAHIQLSEDEYRQALQRFAQERHLRSTDELERYRVQQLLTTEALERQIKQPLRVLRHCQQQFQAKAEARFLERKSQLDRVVYSLLRLQDPDLARELFLQIGEDGADFGDLAATHAEGPEKATRGVIGPVPLTQAHPLLAGRLRTARVGEVLEPFQVESWWLVVRLESLTPASFDEATAAQMSRELFEQWLREGVERRLAELRQQLMAASPQASGAPPAST